jgi:hypothetical protein
MKKLSYIAPETEVINLNLSSPITLDDLFTASQEEESKDPYAGAKEMGDIGDDFSNPNLWDDDEDDDY